MKSNIMLYVAALALTVASCKENDIIFDADDMDYRSVELAAPIGAIHAPLLGSIRKHLNFEDLTTDSEGVICVTYKHSDSIGWNRELGIGNLKQKWNIGGFPVVNVPGGVSIPPQTFKVHLESSTDENVDNSYVSEANVTAGKIGFTLTGAASLKGTIKITIPELTKSGVPFTKNITLPPPAVDDSISLALYKISTTAPDHDLNIEFEMINISGTSTGSIGIDFGITNLDVRYLSGYFGRTANAVSDTMQFNFFEELEFDGTVGFKDIRLTTEATNQVGMPMSVSADLFFINKGGLKKALVMTPPFDFNIAAATESESIHIVTPGKIVSPDAKFTTIIPELLFESGDYPDGLKFDFTGTANPDGETTTKNFIVKDDDANSLAKVELTLTVPLHLKVSEYARTDTVEFDYNDMFDDKENDVKAGESVENLAINLKVNNGLPFTVMLEAFAIDGADNRVETILERTEIEGPTGTAKSKETDISVKLNQEQIKNFRTKSAKNIVLRTSAKTAGEEYVKVTEDAFIDITVSIPEAKFNIPSNL